MESQPFYGLGFNKKSEMESWPFGELKAKKGGRVSPN